MSIDELWTTFTKIQPNFVASYVAYHYYRAHGWVPRTDIKLGVDWVIYELGPEYSHASFGVLVAAVDAETLDELELNGTEMRPLKDEQMRRLTWQRSAHTHRVMRGVAKVRSTIRVSHFHLLCRL